MDLDRGKHVSHLTTPGALPLVVWLHLMRSVLGTEEKLSLKLLKPDEAAAALRISPRTLQKLVAAKAIPHVRVERRCIRFTPAALESWIESRTQGVA